MRLSADAGNTWTLVDDNGPFDSDPGAGSILYIGPVSGWSVTVATAFGAPAVGTPITPRMDLGSVNQSTQPAMLIIQMSDKNFIPFNNETFVATISAQTTGTVTYNTYRDGGNVLFGSTASYAGDPAGISPSATAAPLITIGPLTGGPNYVSNSVVVPVGGAGNYSLTLETIIFHTSAGFTSTDALLFPLPPPTCGGKIGDFIWNDLNGNGCQDAGEPGIAGVKVDLYQGCGVNKSGSIFKTTITDANGNYLFEGLCAGDYTVTITTPNGFIHTVAHSLCGGAPGDVHNPTDSNCECTGADNCDVCVNLPTDTSVDLTIDCGYIGSTPCLTLVKTADTNSAMAGAVMGYTYAVTNCGGTTFTNLAIIDDAGTPGFTADDFSVATGLTLAPGQGASYHVFVSLPVVECVSNSTPPITGGTLISTVLPNGNIEVTFRQSRNLNDNVYGTPAAADGWSSHTFGNLTGSDKAEFRFTDSTGKVVLDFFCDYATATNPSVVFPAGYASLGPNGGDGSMVTGNKSNVLFYTSTLADSLNSTPPFPSLYTVNSPTPEGSKPTWDYVDGYTVIVSSNAFGAAGFGGVTVPTVHNSPAKTGNNQVWFVPCGGCITNIASVVTVGSGNVILATVATDDAIVCTGTPTPPPPTCLITPGAFKIDKNTIQLPLKNNGAANIVLSELDLSWLQSVNGKVTKMSLNGDFYAGPGSPALTSPIAITSGFNADANRRTINKGQTKTLTITFEKNADKTPGNYSGTVKFGAGCTLTFP